VATPPKKLLFTKPGVKEVLAQLTPFVYDEKLESQFDKLLDRRKATIRKIQELVKQDKFSAENLITIIKEDPDEALNAIISVMGLSQEEFFRHITLIRLDKAAHLEAATDDFASEWKMEKITKQISLDTDFANDVLKLLFGERNPEIKNRVPRFLLDKLDKRKIQLAPDALVDSLIRTGLKGRYDVKKGKPIVDTAVEILKTLRVPYIPGEIVVPKVSRKMDIVIPDVTKPYVLIECGIFATTARELSEKALVERQVRLEIEKNYPQAVIVRILDGIGWLARGGDALKDVIAESHYVLTGKTLQMLEAIVRNHVPKEHFRSG